ncbi:MAG: ATP-binding cassette domain-containing protein [Planctomycetales bacterium]|nr:ATP-binding cassette domain-containing protein [Planctomycetales bacterium]
MIELHDIRKTYRVGDLDLPVLKGVSLDIADGEYVAIMGSSGSGKSTLMNLLGSLDYPTAGTFRLDGTDITTLSEAELATFRSRQIGFVFQNFNLLPRTSALDNVLLPTLYVNDGRSQRERVEYAEQLLETVGLGGRLDHTPNQLSGGEKQRVAIARSLINRPKLLLADEPTGNLDSKTEQEILQVFRKLNQDHGITIIVVTHDAEVAHEADRVIHVKDGLIAGDVVKPRSAERAPSPAASRPRESVARGNRQAALASAFNAVGVAAAAMRRNALRTMLTMLGVIIGVASVVSVMELSSGATVAIKDTVSSMGASMLTINPSRGSSSSRRMREVQLLPDDVTAVAMNCSAVKVAAPLVYSEIQLVRGNLRWRPKFCMGTSSEYLAARNWGDLDMGRSFTHQQILDSAKVCVIGKTVADQLFPDEYPIGQEVRANGVSLRVIGVLAPKGGDIIGNDQDDILIGPWTTFKYRIDGGSAPQQRRTTFSDRLPPMQLVSHSAAHRDKSIHQIYIQAQSPEQVAEAREQITSLLCRRHDVDPAGAFQINDITEVTKVVGQVVGGLSALGMVIAAVSLVVGGVGIMNIMLVSVTERTREIGLRMAVGANRRAILRQFLIEATVLCLIGGVVGIVAGHLWSMLVGTVVGWPTVMSIWAPLTAIGVAATVGVIFGYYPARAASRLNPIDALRYE